MSEQKSRFDQQNRKSDLGIFRHYGVAIEYFKRKINTCESSSLSSLRQ